MTIQCEMNLVFNHFYRKFFFNYLEEDIMYRVEVDHQSPLCNIFMAYTTYNVNLNVEKNMFFFTSKIILEHFIYRYGKLLILQKFAISFTCHLLPIREEFSVYLDFCNPSANLLDFWHKSQLPYLNQIKLTIEFRNTIQ